ncbi:MAG: response regulator transcription factor [Devosia sp.]
MRDDFYCHSFPNRGRLIHIADPDPATCEALSVVFRLEGYLTSFSLDAPSFFSSLDARQPDAVILNLRLGNDDGLPVLRRIKAMRRAMAVLIIEDKPQVKNEVIAMKAGAADVLAKPLDLDRLVRAVRDALRQDLRFSGAPRAVEVRGFAQLTPRERDVLRLITDGKSNKEAGRELGISPRTVEVHRARVMEKLGARNTADLVRIVLTS